MSGLTEPSTIQSTTASLLQHANTSAPTPDSPSLSSLPLRLLSSSIHAFKHVDNFAFRTVPASVGRMTGISSLLGGAGPTSEAGGAATHAVADMAGSGLGDTAAQEGSYYFAEFLAALKKLGGFFGYLTSIWSFACLLEALILNRITIYASTRRHLRLGWERRIALRLIPILCFAYQIVNLLRGIRCQTSPSFSTMRYGHPGKQLIFDYSSDGGVLYALSSSLLGWESEEQSCSAVKMTRTSSSELPYGSFSLLWPTFMMLCLSHFIETLSCALQGRQVKTETGMSIFEHSLAFAEAESMIGKSIGLGMFGLPKQNPLSTMTREINDDSTSVLQLLTRSQVLERMNVTPELLLIALISCCNSTSSHILDIFGMQSRYRLFNTALWGACFMAAMSWGLDAGPPVSLETGVLRFPTVCIVGFIPHIMVLGGITICGAIYALALTITAFSMSTEDAQPVSLRDRFMLAHENMQGSNQVRSIRINRHEDFYTTLLRIGYVALTAASEAVFLNEGKAVIARRMTWLEEDRLAEIESHRRRSSESYTRTHEAAAFANFDVPEHSGSWETGYNRERKIDKQSDGPRDVRADSMLGGVGAVRVSIRLIHVFAFFRAICLLVLRWSAYGFSTALDRLGITARPLWLKRLIGHRRQPPGSDKEPLKQPLDFWILSDNGNLELPENGEFDVEAEMRKRERSNRPNWMSPDENYLDDRLYSWWKIGGSWGNQDQTSDYHPPTDDFDTTSVISMSTNASGSEWEDYPSDDGRRTPTQVDPYADRSSSLQDPLLDMTTLARLLDPRDRESREEARILAAHLKTNNEGPQIMTRSRYQKEVERERSRILFSSRLHQLSTTQSGSEGRQKPTAEEESELLEKLILSRRSEVPFNPDTHTWESGAAGLGPNGPPCVVCQTSPRAIITWPCRCLCICEDCRVSLAMNNFGSCVTCRQEVGGFMRLWVP
ncbi:unnamed protein product [Penicillium olsonii]|uniref:Ubiquitin-protein ligase (Asi3) n=1 Tax=Penicillium olsonii TaxID=99116 RepID=A0A9W4HX18_PENOL|nr:unnamed protein product [Penicillium olsonii]CAG8148261.1 unnamed protein product [Penicillium olsonii]CAG8180432.1 unnamed protein product [Penicillium olsonii]